MKIIDINCAVGESFNSPRYRTAQGLVEWMDRYRLDHAVTYQGVAMRDPELGNRQMLEDCAVSGGRLSPCLVVNPSLQSLGIPGEGSALERLRAARPAAIRTFHDDQKYPFTSFFAEKILSAAQELHMPVIVSPTYKPFMQFFPQLPSICADFPDVPLILLRVGFNRSRVIFPVLEKLPNVYFDMSIMLDCGQIDEIVERYGSGNLLFGSGLPDYEPSGALGLLYYSCISQEDKENIAHRNWERLQGGIRYDD